MLKHGRLPKLSCPDCSSEQRPLVTARRAFGARGLHRAALVKQAPRLLRDGKHGELWEAALGAVCKIHS